MNKEEKVIEIHASDMYGFIVETGCSTALSGALMDVPGASKTILFCKQPYSKEYEHSEYGKNYDRSVSREFVEQALDHELMNLNNSLYLKIDFAIVSSWQLASTDKEITHGWYAIWDKKNDRQDYLHFTFPSKYKIDRKSMVNHIADLGVELLYSLIDSDIQTFRNTGMFVLDSAFGTSFVNDTNFELLINCMEKTAGPLLVFDTKSKSKRLEELMRESNDFIIQKGSFNPLHHQHIQMMNSGLKLYPNAKPIFMISTYRYDKPHIDMNELIERIKNINANGYEVMIISDFLFYDAFEKLYREQEDKTFYFVMGSDTINRIIEVDVESSKKFSTSISEYIKHVISKYKNTFRFLIHKRMGYPINLLVSLYDNMLVIDELYQDDGTSSTKIRNGEIINKLN